MNAFLAIVFLGLSVWALLALFLRLRRQRVGAAWWGTLAFLIVCGITFGVWCAFYCEYPVGTRYRFGSFPIPVVVFHLEGGNWIDFPVEKFIMWSVMFANIITVTALATFPLWVISRRAKYEHAQLPA
jgi:hypothetical protein